MDNYANQVVEALRVLLQQKGYDLSDTNFATTPERVFSWMDEFVKTRKEVIEEAKKVLNKISFHSYYQGILLVKDIKLYALCPHHLLPVEMNVSFAYLPAGKVVGLSKIPKFLKILAKALWTQEDYTEVVLDVFCDIVNPGGAMVVVKGRHFCMCMRGVEAELDFVETLGLRGMFYNAAIKEEVLMRLKG